MFLLEASACGMCLIDLSLRTYMYLHNKSKVYSKVVQRTHVKNRNSTTNPQEIEVVDIGPW